MVARALFALWLLASAGCRQILGIEDLETGDGGGGGGDSATNDGPRADGASGDGTNQGADGAPGDATISPDAGPCVAPWVETTNGFCYRMSTDALGWSNARAACVAGGGDLVILNDDAEQSWLATFMGKSGVNQVWIGLSDTVTEGNYAWVDGTPLGSTGAPWATGEPSGGADEDCIGVQMTGANAAWFDLTCGTALRYVCER
jgi:hypothetical protein